MDADPAGTGAPEPRHEGHRETQALRPLRRARLRLRDHHAGREGGGEFVLECAAFGIVRLARLSSPARVAAKAAMRGKGMADDVRPPYSAATASTGAASRTSRPTWASNFLKLSRNMETSFLAWAS